MAKKSPKADALILDKKTVVLDKRLQDQLHSKGFGERSHSEYILDPFESLYLLEKDKLKIAKKSKILSFNQLMHEFSDKHKEFYPQFVVFRDLRDKGFVVRTGFKFGFDFRVYPKGKNPGEGHSEYVVQVIKQSEKFSMPSLSRMVRMSGTLHTKLLMAVIDSENDINYYSIQRNLL